MFVLTVVNVFLSINQQVIATVVFVHVDLQVNFARQVTKWSGVVLESAVEFNLAGSILRNSGSFQRRLISIFLKIHLATFTLWASMSQTSDHEL